MECTAYPSVVSDFLSDAVSVVFQRTRGEITAGGQRLCDQGERHVLNSYDRDPHRIARCVGQTRKHCFLLTLEDIVSYTWIANLKIKEFTHLVQDLW